MSVNIAAVTPPPADTTAPTVSLTAPANGSTVSGSVGLAATAADNVGVSKVEFRADGVLVGTDTSAPYTGTWDASAASAGSHTIQARAYDAANNATNASVSVNIAAVTPPPADTTAPTVSLTAPANGSTVSGSVGLAATASDNVGVSKVEFRADGVLVGTDTSAPYTGTWDASAASAGSHTIQARAYDAANNATNASVSVNIAAVTPPPAGVANVALMANGGQVADYSAQFDTRALADYVIDGKAPYNTYYTGWWVKDPSAAEHVTVEFDALSEVSSVKTVNDGEYGAKTVTDLLQPGRHDLQSDRDLHRPRRDRRQAQPRSADVRAGQRAQDAFRVLTAQQRRPGSRSPRSRRTVSQQNPCPPTPRRQ